MQRLIEIKTVFVKEITEILRNTRILIAAFVFPLLIFPIVFGGMSWLQDLDRGQLEQTGIRVVIPADNQDIEHFIEQHLDIPVQFIHAAEISTYIINDDADIGIVMDAEIPERNLWLYYTASENTSMQALQKIKQLFSDKRFEWIHQFLQHDITGFDDTGFVPLTIDFEDVASDRERSGHKVAKVLPFILIMILVSGCSFAAVDLIAGEKERGCFETLLVSPVQRTNVIIGKMAIVVFSALIGLISNMVSLFVTAKLGFFNLTGDQTFEFIIGIDTILVIFLCSLPMTVLFASLLMFISAGAKSYQSGQTLLMPFTFLAMVPAVTAILPGMRSDSILVLVPVANIVVAIREMLEGAVKIWPMLVGNLVNVLAASGVVILTVRALNREGSLVPGSSTDSDSLVKGFRNDPVKVVFIGFVIVWLGMFYVMAPLQADNLIYGLLLTLWGLIFGAGLIMVKIQNLSFRKTLSLNNPGWNGWLGAVIFQTGFLPVILFLNQLTMKFLPVPDQWLEQFSDSMIPDVSTFALIMLMAVSPGIAEEVLFRGAILGSLRKKWSMTPVILVSGVLFGLLHFSVYRLFGTTMIGFALAWMVYATGSIYPAIVAHTLNNALAIVIIPKLELQDVNEHWFLLGIPLVILGGYLLSFRAGKRDQHQTAVSETKFGETDHGGGRF
jgi:sodium transport system permease protein